MPQISSIGTKKGAKKNSGEPSPGQTSQPPVSAASPVVPVSTSSGQSTQVSDPIDPDPLSPHFASRKRPAEVSQVELDNLAREGIKVFHSVQTNEIFDNDDEVEAEVGASEFSARGT